LQRKKDCAELPPVYPMHIAAVGMGHGHVFFSHDEFGLSQGIDADIEGGA